MRQLVPVSLSLWFVAAVLPGCSCGPDFIVSPPGSYAPETLVECGCLPSEPPGQLVALLSEPGSFAPGAEVTVSLAGRVIQTSRVGPSGAIAMLVAQPSFPGPSLGGSTVDVAVSGRHYAVPVPSGYEAVVHTSGFEEVGRSDLALRGIVLEIQTDGLCPPELEPPDPTPIVELWAGNVTRGTVTRSGGPGLGALFEAHVPGTEGDVALVVMRHASGGASGWFLAGHDLCCGCPPDPFGEGGFPRIPRAGCSATRRAEGRCSRSSVVLDAGPPDAGPIDPGRADAPGDAGLEDAEPQDTFVF